MKLTKREWIKNIAIVFLVIMLILTFFSNTIMNRSLPEVNSQSITSGNIVTQVRGDGIIEAEDPYSVILDETRKVKSVPVKVDDIVEIGDTIYYLEGESGEELTKAKNDLETLKKEYNVALIENNITLAEAESIQKGVTTETSTILKALEEKDKEITALQKEVDELQKKSDELGKKINLSDYNTVDTTEETAAKKKAEEEYTAAQSLLSNYDKAKIKYKEDSDNYSKVNAQFLIIKQQFESADPSESDYYTLLQDYREAERANGDALEDKTSSMANLPTDEQYNSAKADAEAKKQKLAEAEKKLNDKSSSSDKEVNSLKIQKEENDSILKEKSAKLQDLDDARTQYSTEQKTRLALEEKYQEILKKENEVKDLEDKAIGGAITSPVAGKITALSYTAGEKIEAGSTVAVIQIEGKGYTLSFPVTDKQARSVNVGDEVSVVNNWFYDDVTANLVAIKPDKNSQKNGKLLVFSLVGESVQPGQSLTLSVGQKSSNYELIVPNSALREDNNGSFVLIVETKSTPFGSRYIAKRVDVEVIEKDDNNAAINGELFGYEYVITTSSKPLENGDQVKLAE